MVAIIKSHPEDSFGYPQMSPVPLESSQCTLVSVDFTEKTSWWYDSADVEDEILDDSGDGLTFNGNFPFWINKDKIVDDHLLTVSDYPPNGKDVIVKVNDVVQTSGFTVNHTAGTVTFDDSQSGNTVKASYSYAQSSKWEIIPAEGKILRIRLVEVQCTSDLIMNGRTYFDVMVNHPTYGWVVGASNQYKNIRDMIGRSNKGYHIPVCDGLTNEIIVFPWDYPAVIDLYYELSPYNTPAMKLQMRTEGDCIHTGEWGVVTAYCLSRNINGGV